MVSKLTGEHQKIKINLQQAAKAAYSCQGTYYGAFTKKQVERSKKNWLDLSVEEVLKKDLEFLSRI